MSTYRRQILLEQLRPLMLAAALAAIAYPALAALRSALPITVPVTRPLETSTEPMGPYPPAPTIVDAAPAQLPGPIAIASGMAFASAVDANGLTNIAIAIDFINGSVIEPGGRFSFDDTARTWDFNEDSSYLPGFATSVRGLISMRGGGVCWLSTALWQAALQAGLATDYRESHFGFVQSLGAGTDATNTLVIRNNSDVPITIRAWLDDESDVYVALIADGPLDRTATVSDPIRMGPGHYLTTQEVVWDDGDVTTARFDSFYYW